MFNKQCTACAEVPAYVFTMCWQNCRGFLLLLAALLKSKQQQKPYCNTGEVNACGNPPGEYYLTTIGKSCPTA